jgi:hypothetical protein
MGGFIVCALAFVKSFLLLFWPIVATADYADSTNAGEDL